MVEDGGAEALALLGVSQRRFKRAARHAHALRGDADAPAFERAQGDLVALAFAADQVLGRDAAVVEIDLRGVAGMLAQLVFQPRHHITGRAGGHDEGARAFFAGAFVGHGDDDRRMSIFAAGDELLDAVEHVLIALLHRRGAQRRGTAARCGSGQAEDAQHLALRERREPLLFLLRIAVAHEDGIDGAVGDADGGAGAAVAGGRFPRAPALA